ncbi:hypothetical protein IPM09_01595 [Candidatus Saccharibacteria bacterium]|nr:MAG: hypothetical protein IPM09_01595 [Candidatus Saccharibacteria bacterium]
MIALFIVLASVVGLVAYTAIGAYAMGWVKPYARLMCDDIGCRGGYGCMHHYIPPWTVVVWWVMVPAVIAQLVATDRWQRFRRLAREERAEARLEDARQARDRTERLIAQLDASRAEAQASLRRIQDVAA